MLIGAPFFEGFRGGISSVRSVHKMLLRSMFTLDPLLCRASNVFEIEFEEEIIQMLNLVKKQQQLLFK